MLTRSGLGAVVAAAALGLAGWRWHYEESVAIAAATVVAVMLALWASRLDQRVAITRLIAAPRVARGDPIRVTYHVIGSASGRTAAAATIVDRCDQAVIQVDLPATRSGDEFDLSASIPTHRRGAFTVGPWAVQRVDPLRLAVGKRSSDQVGRVLVHPRIHTLQGPYGSMHTVEDEAVIRRSASDPLSGFVSMREYVEGDDPRLIHWPTSARVGRLMLREHVELRRPEFTVVLDASADVATADDFEEMVDVAASVAVHALRSGVEVGLRTTARRHPGALRPLARDTQVLDLLTPIMQVPRSAVMSLGEIFHLGIDHTAIVLRHRPDRTLQQVQPHRPDVRGARRPGRGHRRRRDAGRGRRRGVRPTLEAVAVTRDPGSTTPISAQAVRIALVGALCLVLAVVASEAFGRLLWPLLLVSPIITAVALLTRHQPSAVRWVAAACSVLVAAAASGLADGAVPGELVGGLVGGPRKLLSTEWPSPRDSTVVIAVALLMAVVTAVATALAGRTRLHIAPLLVVAGGLVTAMAIAAPVRPEAWAMATMAAMAVPVALLAPDDDLRSRPRQLLGEWSLPVTAVLLVATALGVSSAIRWTDRSDPRTTPEAAVTVTVLDSIEQMTALRQAQPSIDLFDVRIRGADTAPSHWRLGALDDYDGQRWVPTAELRVIGEQVGLPSPATERLGVVEASIAFLTDDFWEIPLPGRPLEITGGDSPLQSDSGRTTVGLLARPQPGEQLTVRAERVPTGDARRTDGADTRQVDDLAAEFTDAARGLAGTGTVLEQLAQIESTMGDEWQLDSRAPGGQQLTLLQQFITESHRGTEDQFVTAFVLLARSLGVDARIAIGFERKAVDGSATLRSTDASVWPEVSLVDLGWVAFDPVPAAETTEVEAPEPPPAAQSPAAAQPPIPPPAERADTEDRLTADDTVTAARWGRVRTWATRVAVVGGLGVLPLIAVTSTILGLKWRRRRRRLRHRDPALRTIGAWANATDALVDAGLTIRPAWSDDSIAEHTAALAPGVVHETRRLAAAASAATFGPRTPGGGTDRDALRASDAINTWRSIEADLAAQFTRWERAKWRLSTRSLRRATRSPIDDR